MNANNKIRVVKYDPQGIIRSAAQHATFLLQPNEQMIQKFFTAMAEEQPDGSLILPESIRALFAVEVVWEEVKPVPPFESPIGDSAAEKAEAVLQEIPDWDDAFSEYVPVLTAIVNSDSGEFALEEVVD